MFLIENISQDAMLERKKKSLIVRIIVFIVNEGPDQEWILTLKIR
jgi:hypothetical protein